MTELQQCREKQAYYLEEFEKGNISAMEKDTMLQLFWEKIQELETAKGELDRLSARKVSQCPAGKTFLRK